MANCPKLIEKKNGKLKLELTKGEKLPRSQQGFTKVIILQYFYTPLRKRIHANFGQNKGFEAPHERTCDVKVELHKLMGCCYVTMFGMQM